jgi:hypothetical protein
MHFTKQLLLAVLLLTSTLSFGQKTITWYRITNDTSTLNYNPFGTGNIIKTGYYNINPKTGDQYRYTGSTTWVKDSLFKSLSLKDTVFIVTKDTIYISSSGGSGGGADYTPEQYGAIRANQTFAQRGITQDTINALYPGMGFTTSDLVDWAAWQMAVKQATLNGGGVKARGGTYYIGTKSIMIEKYSKYFQIDGNYSKLISTGTTPIFSRPSPTDNSDANTMIDLRCTFRNLVLKGTNTQIGIDIGPTYGAYYQNIMGETLGECIHLRFALRTTVDNCFATNCVSGWVADRGNWAGSSNSNSQSNHTTFRSCRYFGSGDVAFKIVAASGVVVEDCIIEGFSVRAGIDFDGQSSTVVKDFTVRNTHFECTQGATEAFIKVRMANGIVTIDKVFGQYASILADIGATGGYITAEISHVSYWVFKAGKAFNNAGAVGWILKYNENSLTTQTPSTTVPTWFSGTAVQNCSGGGCGSNRYYFLAVPR